MVRSKRNKSDGITIRFVLLHPAIWFIVATSTLIYLCIFTWHRHQSRFLDHDSFQLDYEAVAVTPSPDWVDPMLQQSIRSFVDSRQSLLDPGLLPRAYEHLSTIPWIRRIDKLEKSFRGVDVSLQYREPIAVLDPIGKASLTVDGDGVVFDESVLDRTEIARIKSRLLRINMPQLNLNDALPWHFIGDARILPATRLAEHLAPRKDEFEFYRLVTRSTEKRNVNANPQFELWTSNGTTVIWGSAPGDEKRGEASMNQKLAAIESYVSKFGGLQEFDGRNTHAIDVTSGQPVVIKYERIALKNSWLNTIK